MTKLPKNMVSKPPTFDNPLRRTTPMDGEIHAAITTAATSATSDPEVGEGDSGASGVVLSFSSVARTEDALTGRSEPAISPRTEDRPDLPTTRSEPSATEFNHRITVRIDDATRCALEAEAHRRRIAGEKTNVAEIARTILARWTSRRAT